MKSRRKSLFCKAPSQVFLVAGTSLNYFENGNNITERKKVNWQKMSILLYSGVETKGTYE